MNIVVKPYGSGLCYCRPDTTCEKENRDIYLPEGSVSLQWAPVVFARVSKAGKCVGKKFAARYYDAFNFGVLLYCNSEGSEGNIAFTSCADHSSILPFPMQQAESLQKDGHVLELSLGSEVSFKTEMTGEKLVSAIEEAICSVSRKVSLRIGDLVAVELKELSEPMPQDKGQLELEASYCNNELLKLKVIF